MKKNLILAIAVVSAFGVRAQNALNFDGSNDYIQASNPGPTGTSDRTVEAWIKTTNTASTQSIIVDWGSTSTGGRFTLNMIQNGKIRIEVGGNGFNSTTTVNDGNWHHVAVTYDNSASTKFNMFIDGQLHMSNNVTVSVNTASSTGISIGRRIDGVNYFQGSIDEVRVWNVVRTATEIANSRNAEFCTIPQGLVAYYNFNRGSAGGSNSGVNKAYEAASGNTGTLNNFSLNGSTSNWVSGASLTKGLSVNVMNASTCDSMVSPSGKYVWTLSGVKVDTLTNASNCDSLIRVNLSVFPSLYTVVVDSVCGAYTSPSGNYTYTTSGTYFDTLITSKGCNWVFELNLDITVIDTTVTQTGHQLSANQNNATYYRWLDCAQNYAPIGGASNQVFAPAKDGVYAVKITMNQCDDTSACFGVIGIGLDEADWKNGVNIFPNPVVDHLGLDFSRQVEGIQYSIVNYNGQILGKGRLSGNSQFSLEISDLENGLYVLKLGDGREVVTRTFTVQK